MPLVVLFIAVAALIELGEVLKLLILVVGGCYVLTMARDFYTQHHPPRGQRTSGGIGRRYR